MAYMERELFIKMVTALKESKELDNVYIPSVVILSDDDEKDRYVKRFKNYAIIYMKIDLKSEIKIINELVLGILATNRFNPQSRIDIQVALLKSCSIILNELRFGQGLTNANFGSRQAKTHDAA